jgi:hypothetical protein
VTGPVSATTCGTARQGRAWTDPVAIDRLLRGPGGSRDAGRGPIPNPKDGWAGAPRASVCLLGARWWWGFRPVVGASSTAPRLES